MYKTGTRISLPILRWATKTDYDCEVGSLSSRESWGQLKSGESKALSNFFEKKVKKQFTNTKERVIIYI
tara:strand:+ start:684 stop:890 length:207 start_codon:yes stop_codon:yes gene_type:complete